MKTLKNVYGVSLFIFFTGTVMLFANLQDPKMKEVITKQIQLATQQSDGKIIVTGHFQNGYIYRLTRDKKIDWSFMENNEIGGFNRPINKLKSLKDDSLLVVGDFTAYDQSIVGGLIKLKPDGSIDHPFILKSGVGFDDTVKDMALLPNGQFIVVGDFNSYNGKNVSYIAKINADGSLDESFSFKLDGPGQKIKLSNNRKKAYISGKFQRPTPYFAQIDL